MSVKVALSNNECSGLPSVTPTVFHTRGMLSPLTGSLCALADSSGFRKGIFWPVGWGSLIITNRAGRSRSEPRKNPYL